MKILAHSKDPRGNELITYQGEIPTYLLPELLKFKKMEITWIEFKRINNVDYSKDIFLSTEIITITTSKPALMEFFDKCCPKYNDIYSKTITHKSWKNVLEQIEDTVTLAHAKQYNPSQKEINNRNKTTDIQLQEIAEQMYDLYQKSEAIESKEGEYHIPFLNKISDWITKNGDINKEYDTRVISIALISNPTETDYKKLIEIHDQLVKDNELDTFVHCARVMEYLEYSGYINGNLTDETIVDSDGFIEMTTHINNRCIGWADNYRGFISYKNIIKNEKI